MLSFSVLETLTLFTSNHTVNNLFYIGVVDDLQKW
nr:MAG TPA: hypothetical protein [Caudoviricetes sp.]